MSTGMDSDLNPFSITKSVDLSDREINDYWVDLAEDGFREMIRPNSAMPLLLLGGKGSGKTHIMRYFAFASQKIRFGADISSGVQSDQYVGLYMRCSGLNSARFRGKEQSPEAWSDVFSYYMELWLAQLVVETCRPFAEGLSNAEKAACHAIQSLFDDDSKGGPETLEGVHANLRALQRELDVAVNNCSLTHKLEVEIKVSPGRLIFGIPRALAEHLLPLQSCFFVYLIDEFENLTEPQQKHINTLLRERESPCSFRIGARLYGLRTLSTNSADEDNKEGSEFELIRLDDRLRRNEKTYSAFARGLIVRRLEATAYSTTTTNVDSYFESIGGGRFLDDATDFVHENETREKPYFRTLRQALVRGRDADIVPEVKAGEDVDGVIERLVCPEHPLLEKANCFGLYKRWNRGSDVLEAAKEIQSECESYESGEKETGVYARNFSHFKYDLLAQLRREYDQKQRYVGLGTLIDMSWGLPRNLLILLKSVFSWAVFRGERPFQDKPVSISAQVSGVAEALNWFYKDARQRGSEGAAVQEAIDRLGTLFRSIRFSHKPSECSVVAFSYDHSKVSEETRRIILLAQNWSLLIDVGTQKDRNSERVDTKLQLNRMIAPRWDLPVSRRGVLALNPEEVDAIFDPEVCDQFEAVLKSRIDRMMAPLFGRKRRRKPPSKKKSGEDPETGQQQLLFPFEDA